MCSASCHPTRLPIGLAIALLVSAPAAGGVWTESFDDGSSDFVATHAAVTLDWAPSADRRGHPDSGALRAAITAALPFGHGASGPCVALDGPTGLSFGLWARLQTQVPGPVRVRALADVYSNDDCTGPLGNISSDGAPLGTTSWVRSVVGVPAAWGAHSVRPQIVLSALPPGATVLIDDLRVDAPLPLCRETETTLCLLGNRFIVRGTWRRPNGTHGDATAIALTADTGLLWFFNPNNIEVTVKMLDGCSVNGHYWVFAAGLTNVEVTLTVIDALGELPPKQYTNPLRNDFTPILDTSAIPCTPP